MLLSLSGHTVIEREAEAIGFFVPSSWTFKRTAPTPFDEASAE